VASIEAVIGHPSGRRVKKDKPDDSVAKPKPRRRRDPLEVRLSLTYRFGDEPDDTVRVMDDLPVPMVDSVFKNRDRILRAFAMTLVKAGASKPKVVHELVPGLGLLRAAAGRVTKRK